MENMYQEMKERILSVSKDEWNVQTCCYFVRMIHQASEDGRLTDEQWVELQNLVPLKEEDAKKSITNSP